MPKDSHRLTDGGGIHTNSYIDENGNLVPKGKLDNGQNRNWNNEWDEWGQGYKDAGKTPTEPEFSAQYQKMKNEKYYQEAFSHGAAATADFKEGASVATKVEEAAGALGEKAKTVLKHAGPIGDVAMAVGFVADAKSEGVDQAAKNAVKSATFYDVTVQPVGEATQQLWKKADNGQLNNNDPLAKGLQTNDQVKLEREIDSGNYDGN